MLNYGLPLLPIFGQHTTISSNSSDTTNSLSVSPSVSTTLSMQPAICNYTKHQPQPQASFIPPQLPTFNVLPPLTSPTSTTADNIIEEKRASVKSMDHHHQSKRENMKHRIKAHRKLKQKKREQKESLIKKQLISLCKRELIKGHQFQNLYHLPKTRKAVSTQKEYQCIDKENYRRIKVGDAVILMENRKMFGIAKNVTSECMTVLIPISGYDDYIERNLYWETVFRVNAESQTYLVSSKQRK